MAGILPNSRPTAELIVFEAALIFSMRVQAVDGERPRTPEHRHFLRVFARRCDMLSTLVLRRNTVGKWLQVLQNIIFYLTMNNIHLIGGEKGGVGKSVVARVVAQYMIDKNIPFLGFDTDRSHGSLLRFYADYASPVVVDNYESLDAIVEAASEQADKRVLVDLAAQTHEPLVKWMDDSGVLEAAEELGLTFTYWHVMDSGKDSVDLLKKLLDRFGARLNYVIVLNQLRGDNFDLFNESGERERLMGSGASIITLKRLHEPVINKIDAGSTSFWAAKNRSATDAKGLGLLERQRVKLWLRSAYEQIETVDL
jgi:hypothetical protein